MSIQFRILFVLATVFVAGCASNIPIEISTHPEPELTYDDYLMNNSSLSDSEVRWGGDIIDVENKDTYSLIEILSHELGYNGRPQENDKYQGRFIARINGFLDPEYYTKGRQLTVFGSLDASMQKSIDDHSYTYPVIDVKQFYLWPEYTNIDRRRIPHYGFYPYYYGRYPYPFYGSPYWYGFY